ncbi:MAG: polymer-forming cytoskeletal protein [Gammaproteobacteria bacterium]
MTPLGLPVGIIVLVVAVMTLAGGDLRAETRLSNSVVVSQPLPDDLYAVAGDVRIESSVAGAALLATGRAEISGDVDGDVILAAGRVDLAGGVGDDLRVVAADVQVTGFVIDQATIAGGTVIIGPDSAIGGRAWIAAGSLEMAGQVGDNLRVIGGTVVISGRVAGDVDITAREIRIAPGAVIGGNLVWRSSEAPLIAEDAQILGEVRAAGEPEPAFEADEAPGLAEGWALAIAIAVAALILQWFAPRLVTRGSAAFQAAPGRTLLLGIASLVLTPVTAFVLFATVLGWLLGLVVLAGFLFALMLSGLVGILIVARMLRARIGGAQTGTVSRFATGGWQGLVLVIVVVVALVLAQRAPFLGGFLSTLLMLGGLGALTAVVTGRAKDPGPAATVRPADT